MNFTKDDLKSKFLALQEEYKKKPEEKATAIDPEEAEQKKNSFVRVAHFIGSRGTYTDLYYHNGKYAYFKWDELGISEGKSFLYLRRLESAIDKNQYFYVLTDSMELTYHDVSWSYLASDASTVTKIPFVWLGFAIYFN